jgi:hypothetical protein
LDEKEKSEKLKKLYDVHHSLVAYLENYKKRLTLLDDDDVSSVERDLKLDHEDLAVTFDKTYWPKFANEILELQKTPGSEGEYCSKKLQLSHMIYSRTVICEVNEQGKLIGFKLPNSSVPRVLGLDEKEEAETEKERFTRLSFALKFATQAEDYGTAMKITTEMITEDPTFEEVRHSDHEGQAIKAQDDFVMRLAQLHYKPKKPKIVTFKYQSQNKEIEAPEDPKSRAESMSILPLDA